MSAALPTGTRLAFEREGNIFVATYPNVNRAVNIGSGQDPDISADGKRVAFEEPAKGAGRLFCIRDAATGRVIKRHDGAFPCLSPDGKRVAFSRFVGSRWTLWIADAALTAPRRITGNGKQDPAFPSSWTSNGFLIAYSEQLGGDIYALRPNGSIVRKSNIDDIAGKQSTAITFGCAWSDDLSRIAFEAGTGEELVQTGDELFGLYLYDFATKKRRLLTPRGMSAGSPVWYNRDLLVFTSGRNTKRYTPSQVQVLEVSTGAMRSLVPNAGNASVSRSKA
jgi:Tol biopolymer transport system component